MSKYVNEAKAKAKAKEEDCSIVKLLLFNHLTMKQFNHSRIHAFTHSRIFPFTHSPLGKHRYQHHACYHNERAGESFAQAGFLKN